VCLIFLIDFWFFCVILEMCISAVSTKKLEGEIFGCRHNKPKLTKQVGEWCRKMNVLVNGKTKISLTQFDDENSLLMRYAQRMEKLPSHLALTKNLVTAPTGSVQVVVIDVEDELKGIGYNDITDKGMLTRLSILFPNMRFQEFIYEWLDIFGIPNDISPLRKMNRYIFSTPEITARNVRDYLEHKKERLGNASSSLERRLDLMDKLENRSAAYHVDQQVEISNLQLDSVVLSMAIILPHNEDLYEVFDMMRPSASVPYIVLVSGNNIYTKLYAHIVPPVAWSNRAKNKNGIYFYVLHSLGEGAQSDETFGSHIMRIMEGAGTYYDEETVIVERHYSEGIWTPDNRIVFELESAKAGGIDRKSIKKTVVARFKTCIQELNVPGETEQYDIRAKHQTRLKATSFLEGATFQTLPFADLTTNDDFFRELVYFSETSNTLGVIGKRTKKSAPKKPQKLPQPDENKEKNPSANFSWVPVSSKNQRVSAILNLEISNKDYIGVKMSGFIRTKLEALVYLRVFRVLLLEANQRAPEIYDEYAKLTTLPARAEKKTKTQKKGKHIDKRAHDLQLARPQLFIQGYPGKCAKERQPQLVDNKTAKKLRKEFIEKLGAKGEYKLMEYPIGSGDNYVCDPRDVNDEKPPFKHLWPGLRENKGIIREDVGPYWPCCFISQQYTKKASLWRTYKQMVDSGQVPPNKIPPFPGSGKKKAMAVSTTKKSKQSREKKEKGKEKITDIPPIGSPEGSPGDVSKKAGGDFLLAVDKTLDPGRMGKVPFYLAELLANHPSQDISPHRQNAFLRKGVDHSPDSFFKCVLLALGKYDPSNASNSETVSLERGQLLQQNLAPLRQTMFDRTVHQIRELLTNESTFMDSTVFLPFLEWVYNVNIYVIEVDTDRYPGGKISVPRHHPFTQYLPSSRFQPGRSTIVMTQYSSIPPKDKTLESISARELNPFQYELVVQLVGGPQMLDDVVSIFPPDSGVSRKMASAFFLANRVVQLERVDWRQRDGHGGHLEYHTKHKHQRRLLQKIKYQTLDNYGKTRMLWIKGGGPLFVFPMAPLGNVKEKSYNFEAWRLSDARKWCEANQFALIAQDGSQRDNQIQGLWVAKSKNLVYVPVHVPTTGIEGLPWSDQLDPWRLESGLSSLDVFRRGRLLADYLLQHTFFGFSRYLAQHRTQVSDKQAVDDYFRDQVRVEPRLKYPLDFAESKNLAIQPPFFDGGQLLVENEDTKDRLRSNLMVHLINDPLDIYNYRDHSRVQLPYSRIQDFISRKDQLLFLSEDAFDAWRRRRRDDMDAHRNLIPRKIYANLFPPGYEDPYFFQHPCVGNRLCIVQNVIGSKKEVAAYVSFKWLKKRFNVGYKSPSLIDTSGVVEYVYGLCLGNGATPQTHQISVLRWGSVQNYLYAAVLFVE
jgi:hypothetical protein